jgi:hypothetical protein
MGPVIRFMAIAFSCVVALGFILFAIDETSKGSTTQQQKLERELNPGIAPTPEEESARERQNGSAREVVDDANDVLLAPFATLINSNSAWVNHGVPALIGLLIYGFGLGLLANMLPQQRQHGSDWRAAGS